MSTHRTMRTALAVFTATFLALTVAGTIAVRRVPSIMWARQVTPFVRYPDPSWYLVFYRRGAQLDHTVLWNGIGSSIEQARRADVLFLGNSRTQFALPAEELRRFEKRSRLRPFSLALPFVEPWPFPLRILTKFDLRPKVVVANADEFFWDGETDAARQIVDDGWWGGFAQVIEERLASKVWPIASQVLPTFRTWRPAHYLLRSSTSGAWLPVEWPHRHRPAGFGPDAPPDPRALSSARRFHRAVTQRGALLVLTCVPSAKPTCSPTFTKALAAALGVPAIVPVIDPLWTGDGSHLCPLSGTRFGRTLLRELAALDIVRKLPRR